MEATKSCTKPLRKQKRKKYKSNRHLDQIVEEASDASIIHEDVTQTAAVKAVADITDELYKLLQTDNVHIQGHDGSQGVHKPSIDASLSVEYEIEKISATKESHDEPDSTVDTTANEAKIANIVKNEIHKDLAMSPELMLNNESHQPLTEQNSLTEVAKNQIEYNLCSFSKDTSPLQNISLKQPSEEKSLKSIEAMTASHEVHRLSDGLRPSVFVGTGRLFSTTLQINSEWDRSKYNPVLLPNLTKVVYPELDSFSSAFSQRTQQNWSPKSNFTDLLRVAPQTATVDRSCKPKLVYNKHYQISNSYQGHPSAPMATSSSSFVSPKKVESSGLKHNYQEYVYNGDILKIYMNPVQWKPVENQQLVLFEVNSIAHEEFFFDCKSTDGLVSHVKQRASYLSNQQTERKLKTLCFGDEDHYAYMKRDFGWWKIHSLPYDWDPKVVKRSILFEVNNVFYEETFTDSKNLDDLIDTMKIRVGRIKAQQEELQHKIHFRAIVPDNPGPPDEPEDIWVPEQNDSEALAFQFEEYARYADNKDTLDTHKPQKKETKAKKPERKGAFSSFRNWLKTAFKKESKPAQKVEKPSPFATGSEGFLGDQSTNSSLLLEPYSGTISEDVLGRTHQTLYPEINTDNLALLSVPLSAPRGTLASQSKRGRGPFGRLLRK